MLLRPFLFAAALGLVTAPGLVAKQTQDGGVYLASEAASPTRAQPDVAHPEPAPRGPVVFLDTRLQDMVADLERNSPTAAAMIRAIREAGIPLIIGTFADLREDMKREYRHWDLEGYQAAGLMAPVVRRGPGFGNLITERILLAINLDTLDDIFDRAIPTLPTPAVPWEEIRRLEILAVIGHEVAHAYGLAMSDGNPRLGCPDPAAHERPQDTCVMTAENIVRREIGAPPSWEYGFVQPDSLMARYQAADAHRRALLEIARFRPSFGATRPPLPSRDWRAPLVLAGIDQAAP